MTHDPMCTTVLNTEMSEAFCDCDLIIRVREDERRQAVERVRVKKGKFPSTRLEWGTIADAILNGTKLRLSKKELNESAN